jgi:hypothetical protein
MVLLTLCCYDDFDGFLVSSCPVSSFSWLPMTINNTNGITVGYIFVLLHEDL